MGMTHSPLHLAGPSAKDPAGRRQGRADHDGLHLLVDSTGIKMLGEGEWNTKKLGADYRRQWRKMHLGIDASTLEIGAKEVTDNSVGMHLSASAARSEVCRRAYCQRQWRWR